MMYLSLRLFWLSLASITHKTIALKTSSGIGAWDRASRVQIDACFILSFEQQLSLNTLQLHCTPCRQLKLSVLPRCPLPLDYPPPPLQWSHPSRELLFPHIQFGQIIFWAILSSILRAILTGTGISLLWSIFLLIWSKALLIWTPPI